MNDFVNLLGQDLHKGFVDKTTHAIGDYQPKLLLNSKERTVLDDLQRDLQNCDEFWFSVAFLTTDGLASLIETLKELGQKGVQGKILVSEYLHFTKPEALRKLLKLEHIQSRIVKHELRFHQKGYMFKSGNEHSIIIGSSNLTASALQVNSELNIRLTATDNSQIIDDVINEFKSAFEQAQVLDFAYIEEYEEMFVETEYRMAERISSKKIDSEELVPNKMQQEALDRLSDQRTCGINKSLIISATATGKTILSAFDVKQTGANRCLFVVHRRNIAIKAMSEFKKVFGSSKTMGLYSGDQKDKDADFIFATIQTISRDQDLNNFKEDEFDYIIIDETHRAGASTYQKFMDHFKPDFMLGMTATPERSDDFDIFAAFDHNIGYEIRLNGAMENKLVCPFHYYGVTDATVDGQTLEEDSDFNLLVHEERVNRIIEKVEFYGTDNGDTRGLIFCSRVDEAATLSNLFNEKGYKTVSLSGLNSEEDRQEAIDMLQSDDCNKKLDYVFAVDIFNEGIDIPKINQVVMLRPTNSAIIFVQQLGRGLRLHEDKEYLTIIDFIGNYKNSYLVPIALFGDTTYNKDNLRKLISSGSTPIPGSSTINFDEISKKQIFDSIDTTNLSILRDLRKDYIYLKNLLGRMPMMMDFLEHASRDPYHFIKNQKSYYNFVANQEKDIGLKLDPKSIKLLECFALHVNNTVRLEESVLLLRLIDEGAVSINEFKEDIFKYLTYHPSDATVTSVINNLNFGYMTENEKESNKKIPIGQLYGFDIVRLENDKIYIGSTLKDSILNSVFTQFLRDNTQYSIHEYIDSYDLDKFQDGFVLYRKYERKDIFRILNWKENPVAQNVGGYILSKDKTQFPIFVTYEKEADISDTTKYEDHFISQSEFAWMSKSKRTINSPEIKWLLKYYINNSGCRIPLFIKKSDNEGIDFYYIGELMPDINSVVPDTISGTNVVKVNYFINPPVEENLYQYLIDESKIDEPKRQIEISDSVPFHLFCAGCVDLIIRIWGHQIYEMANRLYDFGSDYEDKVKLNSSEDELVKDYVNQFEHYIGNIGSQVDSIAKILGTPKISFPKQISKWKKHYEGAWSPALYQPPDQPKLFVDWWRKISKPIKKDDYILYGLDEEKGRITGPRSLLIKNWDELKNEDKDKIRIAMEKINSYFEYYLRQLNQLNNRLASTRLLKQRSFPGDLEKNWGRFNELHSLFKKDRLINIEYPNLSNIVKIEDRQGQGR